MERKKEKLLPSHSSHKEINFRERTILLKKSMINPYSQKKAGNKIWITRFKFSICLKFRMTPNPIRKAPDKQVSTNTTSSMRLENLRLSKKLKANLFLNKKLKKNRGKFHFLNLSLLSVKNNSKQSIN